MIREISELCVNVKVNGGCFKDFPSKSLMMMKCNCAYFSSWTTCQSWLIYCKPSKTIRLQWILSSINRRNTESCISITWCDFLVHWNRQCESPNRVTNEVATANQSQTANLPEQSARDTTLPKIQGNLALWNIDQVADYFKSLGFTDQCKAFIEQVSSLLYSSYI